MRNTAFRLLPRVPVDRREWRHWGIGPSTPGLWTGDACRLVGAQVDSNHMPQAGMPHQGSSSLSSFLKLCRNRLPGAAPGDHNEFALAIFPSMTALGFRVRFWVSRSTAINPNFGA